MVLKCTPVTPLVLLLMVLLLTPILAAQEIDTQDEELSVIIQGSPENPIVGSTWVLTLLVAHSEPNEVEVIAPPFTGPFVLEQISKGPRYVDTTETWTVVEYRFKANNPGNFSFDAFTVITPDTQVKSNQFEVTVLRSATVSQTTAEKQNYRLVWEGIPSSLTVGESAVFYLRVSGWNSTPNLLVAFIPETGLFVPPVPPGHILESLPLSREERSTGTALKLRLVPLEAVPFTIASRLHSPKAVNGQEVAFEIPSLRIPVIRPQGSPAVQPITNGAAQKENTVAPFPPFEAATAEHPNIINKQKTECEAVYADAKKLWGNSRYAEALAMLRKNERDHPAGKVFAVIRRRAEQALGFSGTDDERRDIIMKIWLFTGRYRCGVLMETTIRRIPDQAGEEITRYREGQPVLVLKSGTKNSRWLQIITGDNNKTSGWIPEDKIIFY
jgi:hypothetical protein